MFPKQVFAELERHSRPADPADLPYQWAKKHKSHACRLGTDYSRLHTLLAHPQIGKVVDPDKTGVEEADPYVLALADELKERYEVTILCEEVRDRPDKLSMASACGLLRIVTLRLGPFLVSQRIYPKP